MSDKCPTCGVYIYHNNGVCPHCPQTTPSTCASCEQYVADCRCADAAPTTEYQKLMDWAAKELPEAPKSEPEHADAPYADAELEARYQASLKPEPEVPQLIEQTLRMVHAEQASESSWTERRDRAAELFWRNDDEDTCLDNYDDAINGFKAGADFGRADAAAEVADLTLSLEAKEKEVELVTGTVAELTRERDELRETINHASEFDGGRIKTLERMVEALNERCSKEYDGFYGRMAVQWKKQCESLAWVIDMWLNYADDDYAPTPMRESRRALAELEQFKKDSER